MLTYVEFGGIKGDYQASAVLAVFPEHFPGQPVVPWTHYVEDGLGKACGALFRVPSGQYFGFEHLFETRSHQHTGTAVLTLFGSNDEAATLNTVLEEFGFTSDQLNWIRADIKFIPHDVIRLDDNGVENCVGSFRCEADAKAKIRTFESSGHKQTFWSRPSVKEPETKTI